MATLQKLVNSSMRLIGVLASGETPSGAEGADAKQVFNDMLETWRLDGLLAFSEDRQVFTDIVVEQSTYTIGASGADWTLERPVQIGRASWSYTTVGADSPLEIPMSVLTTKQWQHIGLKETDSSISFAMYYEPDFPLGKIHLYPEPSDAAHDLVIYVWNVLAAITSLSTTVSFPPGYYRALRFNLALDLAPEFGANVPPQVRETAEESLLAIQRVNTPWADVEFESAIQGGSKSGNWDYRTGENFRS